MRLEDLVLSIEDYRTEFAGSAEGGAGGWLKTIVAFANCSGGDLYVGVDGRTHELDPLDQSCADATALMLRRLIKQRVEPDITYEINAIPVKLSDRTGYVLKISVESSKALPVMLHEDGLVGIFVREGSGNVLATAWQIRDLVLRGEHVPYDECYVEECYSPDSFSTLHRVYRERTGQDLEKDVLVSAGFMRADGRLSRGALLFKDSLDNSNTRVVCTRWPGLCKDSPEVLAALDFSGNLLECIQKATDFVMNHSVNGFRKEAAQRVDFFSYPARSVTEGIVNAVAHRNYFISGTQIEVDIFKDRLEITSPGALLGVSRLDREKNIASIIPRRRNEVICRILVLCRYMAPKGSGFDKIEEDYYGQEDSHKPFVTTDSDSFRLTLPDLTYSSGVVDVDTRISVFTDQATSGKNDLEILAFCYTKARSAQEIADHVGIRASSYFRNHVLQRLVGEGYMIENSASRPAKYHANRSKVFVG